MDVAIQVSLKTNMPLVIAGIVPNEHGAQEYFETKVKPHIDNKQIKFIGAINDFQKQILLSRAIALLFPIRWNEPFGMVMIEALSCGTPVIAANVAAVPEIIEDGVTGFLCNPNPNMITSFVDAVNQIDIIDRRICRERCTERFDSKLAAKNIVKVLEEIKTK